MNILQRINKVRNDIEGVAKDTNVSMGKGSYLATSHDGVITKLRPALVAHGIVFWVSSISDNTTHDQYTDQYGKIKHKHFTEVHVGITYASESDKDDCITVYSIGHGEDFGDKAAGKAISYAVKYAHLKTFALVTGLNDEDRLPEYSPKLQIGDQIANCTSSDELGHLWTGLNTAEKAKYKQAVANKGKEFKQ